MKSVHAPTHSERKTHKIRILNPRVTTKSHISQITFKDKSLVKSCVQKYRPYSNAYEDSWGYIIQSTRYGGFKWYDPKTSSLLFFGRKSPTDNTLVVTSFYAQLPYLIKVLDILKKNGTASKVIMKNIDPDDINEYIEYGFRQYYDYENWIEKARFDDQTYPQLIVDLEKTLEAKGKRYHQLRRILNKNPNVSMRKYTESDRDDVSIILTLKDGSKPNALDDGIGIYYSSHIMYLAANIDKYVVCNNTTGEILGFVATSDISLENTTLVASIFKPGVQVASVWGIYQALKIKYQEGFKTINLGGLETIGSYTFLSRTFRPVNNIKRTHLVYEPE